MLVELTRREEDENIKADPDIENYMKVGSLISNLMFSTKIIIISARALEKSVISADYITRWARCYSIDWLYFKGTMN